MARVTVEDCIEIVPNRFELIVLAAQRTRQIFAGAPLTIERGNDKYPVVALREIAEQTVDTNLLSEAVVANYRKHIQLDETEQEMADMLLNEKDGSLEIGANSFEEILTEEELAASFLADEDETEEGFSEPDEDDMGEEESEE